MSRFILSLAVSTVLLAPGTAAADESFHTCQGFVTAVPTVISTQGVWCLSGDLATSLASGTAITVDTNNVTLDCNGFKLGNLAAGAATQTAAIGAANRRNLTVRDCNIRGFATGIDLGSGGGGHLIEDNRIEAPRFFAISVGDASAVRRNRIFDVGGTLTESFWRNEAYGIIFSGSVEIEDNLIDGFVLPPGTASFEPAAIISEDEGFSRIVRNTVRNMVVADAGDTVIAIQAGGRGSYLGGNVLGGPGMGVGFGISCDGQAHTIVRDNVISLFPVAIDPGCTDAGNRSLP